MSSRKEAGFTYIALLLLIAVWSISLCVTVEVFEKKRQRDLQKQITWEAEQYVNAIESYYYSAPIGKRKLPGALSDLVEDNRTSPPARHLRSISSESTSREMTLRPLGGGSGIFGVEVMPPGRGEPQRYIFRKASLETAM